MIQDIKPYPGYKDSGVPWLESLPVNWQVLRGKNVFRIVDIRSKTGDEELLTVSSRDGVVPRSQKNVTMFMAESYVGHKLCWPGDLVVNSLWAWMQGLGFSRFHGLISSAYSVYRPKPEHSIRWKYLDYLFRSASYKWEFHTRSKGVWLSRLQLSDTSFLDMPVVIPPQADTQAIVLFLDHADLRIRRFIRAKRRMIELLNEQKQTITHHAVTHGLNPDVRLKPSGVQWLGDVPEHWEVILLGRCVSHIEQGWSPVAADGDLDEDQWAVLTLSSVRRGFFNSTAIKPVSKSAKIPSGIEVSDGDFLLTRSNTRDRVGDVCIVEGVRPKTILCDLIYRLQIQNEKINPRFLMYQLLAPLGRGQIERDARGSSGTMPKIAQGHIKAWKVVLPSIEEQGRIATYIDAETNKINEIIDRSQREIDIIREYRTRLITDVVTGKLDVRGVAVEAVEEELEGLLDTDVEEIDDEMGADEAAEE